MWGLQQACGFELPSDLKQNLTKKKSISGFNHFLMAFHKVRTVLSQVLVPEKTLWMDEILQQPAEASISMVPKANTRSKMDHNCVQRK